MEPEEEQVPEDNTTRKMLFKEGIQGLNEDEFEDSKTEHDIFMAVFFGKKNGSDATITNATSLTTLPCSNGNCPSKSLPSFSSFASSTKSTFLEPFKSLNNLKESECDLGSSSCQVGLQKDSGKCNNNKEEKHSTLNAKNGAMGLGQPLPATSALKQNPQNLQHSAPCYVVEACGREIFSGYYFKDEDAAVGDVDTTSSTYADAHCKSKDGKDNTLEINVATAAALSSQDNFDVGLPVADADNDCIEKKELTLKLEKLNIADKKADFKDLPSHLNSFDKQLLTDSGYIVEACGRGIFSGYYFKEQGAAIGDANTTSSTYTDTHYKSKDGKDSTLEINVATAAPISSQDNFDVGPRVADADNGYVEKKELTLELEKIKVADKKANFKDLPSRLNSFGKHLLTDSGWQIKPRVQSHRNKLASYFIAPKGRPVVTSFIQAWKLCGGELHWHASDSEIDKTGREWTNIDSFWSDLIETLFYIEKATQSVEDSISLLQRWQLLDPFIAVVCVDRRINILREGKMVKAFNSTTVVLSNNDNTVLAYNGVGTLDTSATPSSRSNENIHYGVPVAQVENMLENVPGVIPHPHDLQGKKSCKQGKRKLHCNTESQEKRNHKRRERHIGNRLNDDNFSYQTGVHVTPDVEISPVHDQNSGRISFVTGSSYMQEVKDVTLPNLLISESNKLSDKLTPKRTYSDEDGIDAGLLSAGKVRVPNEQSDEQRLDLQPGISDGSCGMVTASSPEKMNSSANQVTSSCEKPHKKCKRTPDVGMTEVGTKCNRNYQEFVTCQPQQKSHDHFEDASNLEMPDGMRNSMSQELEENSCASLVVQTCSIAKLEKNAVKSGKRVSKQQVKQNKVIAGMHLEGKLIDVLSGVDKDQEDVSSSKHVKYELEGLSSKRQISLRKPQKKMTSTRASVIHDSAECEVSAVVSIAAHDKKCDFRSSSISPDQQDSITVTKKKSKVCKRNLMKRPRGYRINDDDLLIAAILKRKDYGSCNKVSFSKVGPSKRKSLGKFGTKKGPRLLLRATVKSGKYSKDGQEITLQARTVLNWLIHMGAITLKDTLQYRNPKHNALLKEGKITRGGIVCNCCTKVLSVSDFKVHAGSKNPKTTNLFLQSGRSYTLCQIQAWSAEYAARKDNVRVKIEDVDKNDDTCGICGDGGELICCDNCPSTYHEACLPEQDIPDGSWYCHNCVCRFCGDVAREQEPTLSLVKQCSQCERKYHDICIKEKVEEVGSDTWFCGRGCQMVYFGLRSQVGESNYLGDGYSCTILRCNHDDNKVYSAQKIAHMAECNTRLAIALNVMEECFLPMVDPRTGIDMIPHVLYNWGSDFARLNYQGFYTFILEKGDELISVASLRVHGFTVAEIPLIVTCSEHRRQGMGRKLMDAIEKILKSLKVKSIVLSAIAEVADTWITGFGFKPIEDEERRSLRRVNLMLFPGAVLLIKNLDDAAKESGGDGVFHYRVTQTQNLDVDDKIKNTETARDNSVTTELGSGGSFPTRKTLDIQNTNQQGRSMISHEVPILVDKDHHYGAVSTLEPFTAHHLSSEGQAIEEVTFHSVDGSDTMNCSSFSISNEDNQFFTEPSSRRSNCTPQNIEQEVNGHLNTDQNEGITNSSLVRYNCPANGEAGDGSLIHSDSGNGKLEELCGKKLSLDASNGIRSSGMCM